MFPDEAGSPVALCTCIRELPFSNLGRDISCLDGFIFYCYYYYYFFGHSLFGPADPLMSCRLVHECLVPDPFQIVIHMPSYNQHYNRRY